MNRDVTNGSELHRPIHRILEDLWQEPFHSLWSITPRGRAADNYPALNVWHGPEDVLLTCEIPGVAPEDLHVLVERDVVKIWGERKPPALSSEERVHRRERPTGEFRRAVTLPYRLDPDGVEATYEKGVLRVRAPRAHEDRARRIEVKSS